MLIFVAIFVSFACLCNGKPHEEVAPQNVVTVPPNCPVGQEWVNGQCRDVWIRLKNELQTPEDTREQDLRNVVTVPTNCPAGQEWVNGICRDVWRSDVSVSNVITVPPNCPSGQEYVNGICRDVWKRSNIVQRIHNFLEVLKARMSREEPRSTSEEINIKNIISVPSQCPAGYRPDALGNCRLIIDTK